MTVRESIAVHATPDATVPGYVGPNIRDDIRGSRFDT